MDDFSSRETGHGHFHNFARLKYSFLCIRKCIFPLNTEAETVKKKCIDHRVLRRRSVLSHTFDDKQLRGTLLLNLWV